MKRYRYFIGGVFAVVFAYFLSLALFNYVLDPICIFHEDFRTFNQNRRFTLIEDFDKLKTDVNGILVGSSRIGNTYPRFFKKFISDANFYCFSIPRGTISDYKKVITYAFENSKNIKTVYLMLDEIELRSPDDNFTLDNKMHYKISGESPLAFYSSYLFSFFSYKSYVTLKMWVENDFEMGYKYYPDGSYKHYELEDKLNKNPQQYVANEKSFKVKRQRTNLLRHLDESVAGVKDIVKLCKENNANLYIVYYPANAHNLDSYCLDNYINYIEAVAKLHGFWFFGGYNKITTDDRNYLEDSHCSEKVPPLMLEKVFSKQGKDRDVKSFGVYVDSTNIDALVRELREEIKLRDMAVK